MTVLKEANPEQLEQAVAANHREWLLLQARVAGGEVHEVEGVTWTYSGPNREAVILFPQLAEATADAQIDGIVRFYLERGPKPLVGCWSLAPTQPADLEVRLLARGFQLGWWPHWLALDFAHWNTEFPRPDGLEIERLEEVPQAEIAGLPYYDAGGVPALNRRLQSESPQVRYFVAKLDGQVVGHSTVCLTTGPLGVAGLYDIGVVPAARRKGVGKAVTLAACQHAATLGYQYALLNGTGDRMYRQLGFESLGEGRTWWLNVPRLAARPPTSRQIALAEAVGRGDMIAIAAMSGTITANELNEPLTNEMTLAELAVHAEQPQALEWLTAHGATPPSPE